MAAAGNGRAQAAFRYTALASTRLVPARSKPGLSRSLIFPAVCSAMNWLISCLARSAARRKSASRTVTAAEAASAAVKAGSSGRPDCTHMVLGARSVRSPAARSRRIADPARRPGRPRPGWPGAGPRRSGLPSHPGPRAEPGAARSRCWPGRTPGCPSWAADRRDRRRTPRRHPPRTRGWRRGRRTGNRAAGAGLPEAPRNPGCRGRAARQGPGAPGGPAPRAAPPASCRRRT